MTAYTTHGHVIPGSTEDHLKPEKVARCGGPGLCRMCALEVSRWVIPSADDWTVESSRYNEDTLFKVQKALLKSGLDMQQAFNSICEMQNDGILFRERMS